MISISENGNIQNIANAQTLIEAVHKINNLYMPHSKQLEISKLKELFSSATLAQIEVDKLMIPYKEAVNLRKLTCINASSQLTIVLKQFKTTEGVSDFAYEKLATLSRQFQGEKNQIAAKEMHIGYKNRSAVSAINCDQCTNIFGQVINTLKQTPQYNPKDPNSKIEALTALHQQMLQETQQMITVYTLLTPVRAARSVVLYLKADNLVDTFNLSRMYLLGILPTHHPQYKVLLKLRFRKQLL